MFSKNSNNTSFEVIIGEHTTFDGDIKAEGNIKVEGNVTGNIKSNGEIFIGKNSTVKGDITATNLTISGDITGEIKVIGELKITESGKLKGDILVSSFSIDTGGIFKGNCNINTDESKDDLESLKLEFETKLSSISNDNNNDESKK